jgi:histone arginine demethylase JMJD6
MAEKFFPMNVGEADRVALGSAAASATDVATTPVERVSGMPLARFVERYRDPRTPVILSDAAQHWPAYGKFTPDWFRAHFAQKTLRLQGRDWTLAEILDVLEASTQDKPGPYPCKFEIARDFSELLPAVTPRFAYSLPDRQVNPLVPRRLFSGVNNLEIFFGGLGGRFPYLHYDLMHQHAWITQLYGDKEFTLYAPNQEPFLYVNPDEPWQSTIQDHHAPDYARYPLLRQARSQKVVIRAGETLFLPCGWWHTARSLNVTISVAFDQLGPDNWKDFRRDVLATRLRRGKRLLGAGLHLYLGLLTPVLAVAERLGADRDTGWADR